MSVVLFFFQNHLFTTKCKDKIYCRQLVILFMHIFDVTQHKLNGRLPSLPVLFKTNKNVSFEICLRQIARMCQIHLLFYYCAPRKNGHDSVNSLYCRLVVEGMVVIRLMIGPVDLLLTESPYFFSDIIFISRKHSLIVSVSCMLKTVQEIYDVKI